MIENLDLEDATVVQIFELAKCAFLDLDVHRTGLVNVELLFQHLHVAASDVVPAGPATTLTYLKDFANESGEISLLDLLSNLVHFVDGRDMFGSLQPSFLQKMEGNKTSSILQ